MGREYGLIGKSLKHSFSRDYFTQKFSRLGLNDHVYSNFELADIRDFPALLKSHPGLKGLNVTLPYKVQIMPYLDELSAEASETGAVNCIAIHEGRSKGYNTDVYGFAQSIKPFLDRHHERALILGTGGASRAVASVLEQIGVDYRFVSTDPRKKSEMVFLYEDLNEALIAAFKLIVNCSPLGMFPDVDTCPALPYGAITPEHLAYDLVYNPPETLFLKNAAAQGAICVNGLSMLKLQAEKSWEIWNS